MAHFIYSGPPSGVTLATDTGAAEILLWPGRTVDLPAEHAYVATLRALGHLRHSNHVEKSEAPKEAV